MLKRKATAFIENWIQSKEKKCLVVQGAMYEKYDAPKEVLQNDVVFIF